MFYIRWFSLIAFLQVTKTVNNTIYSSDTGLYSRVCEDVLIDFATNTSAFTDCSVRNARPVTICTNCVKSYLGVMDAFKSLQNRTVNGKSCESFLTSQDRLDIVRSSYKSIIVAWSRANCDNCFERRNNETIISNATKTFNELLNNTKECIKKYPSNTNDTSIICKACLNSYVALNDFYKSLSNDATGVETVCMDTVDSMNATREIWSSKLDCCKMRKSGEVIFLVCTSIISLLPVIFYLLVRYYTPRRNILLSTQTRFNQNWPKSSGHGSREE